MGTPELVQEDPFKGPQQSLTAILDRLTTAAAQGKFGPSGSLVILSLLIALITSVVVCIGFWGWHGVNGDRVLTNRLEAHRMAMDRRLDQQDERIDELSKRLDSFGTRQERILLGVEVIAAKVEAPLPSMHGTK